MIRRVVIVVSSKKCSFLNSLQSLHLSKVLLQPCSGWLTKTSKSQSLIHCLFSLLIYLIITPFIMQTMEIMVCLLWPWDLCLGLEERLLLPGHRGLLEWL